MGLPAMRAGDIPAPPSLSEWGAVIHQRGAAVNIHHAVLISGERTDQVPGHPHAFGRGMTFEALVASVETGVVLLDLVESVEYPAQFWICHGDFQQGRTRNKPDVNIVVEEKGAGDLGRNALALQGGF